MHLRIATASLAAVFCLGCGSPTPAPVTDGGETPVSVKLSGKDESCTRTADCATDLICVDQTCVTAVPAPVEPVPTRLGGRGETCQVTADCGTGLVCWPVSTGTGATGLGRCDLSDFGLTPTGMACGAECKTAADCCELPLQLQVYGLADAGTTYRSCEDLAAKLGANKSGCEEDASDPRDCFLYKTYCDCGTAWACNSGACSYVKACTGNGEVKKGCPTYSRTRSGLVTTCNSTSHTCAPEAVTTGCTTDASCNGKPVTDALSDNCSAGECVCVASTGACYRRCRNDLECDRQHTCDVTRQLCVTASACDNDAFCARDLDNAAAKCVNKACKLPCTYDLECNLGSGLGRPFDKAMVCNANYCEALGCSSDTECSVAVSDGTTSRPVKTFCTAAPAASTVEGYASAITN